MLALEEETTDVGRASLCFAMDRWLNSHMRTAATCVVRGHLLANKEEENTV